MASFVLFCAGTIFNAESVSKSFNPSIRVPASSMLSDTGLVTLWLRSNLMYLISLETLMEQIAVQIDYI